MARSSAIFYLPHSTLLPQEMILLPSSIELRPAIYITRHKQSEGKTSTAKTVVTLIIQDPLIIQDLFLAILTIGESLINALVAYY